MNETTKTLALPPPKPLARAVAYAKSFPAPVWLLTLATMVESTGRFMVVPYLSLYLSGKGVSLGALGVVLGMAPLASVAFGVIGGQLSDRWGRKPVQILGVLLSGSALFGFAFAGTNLAIIALCNFLNGLTRTFYRPATQAAISDFTPSERKSEAFALNRIAINAAFGWGPLIGVAIFASSPTAGFIAAGSINLAVGLFIALAVPESAPAGRQTRKTGVPPPTGSWKDVLSDGTFWLWTAGMAVVWGAYDLIQSFLPLRLRDSGVPLWVYGALLATNSLVCVFGQLPVSRMFRTAHIGKVAAWSKLGFAAGFVAFGFATSPWILIGGMLILSIGEIVGSAGQVRFVPERAKPELLGRYMGLSSMSELGRAFSAPAMGFVMEAWGGSAVFVAAAGLSAAGALMLGIAGGKAPLEKG